MDTSRYLTAAKAAAALGISLPTLYAYVSRGLVRSEAAGQRRRDRRYSREDVDRLRLRQEQRRHPERAAQQSLSWGVPVLESSLSLIVDGRLYYRGREAVSLAGSQTFDAVARWLWTGQGDGEPIRLAPEPAALGSYQSWLNQLPPATPVERMQAILLLAAARDMAAYDLRPAAVAQTGARLLSLLAAAAVFPATPTATRLAEYLQRGWQAASSAEQARQADRAHCICAVIVHAVLLGPPKVGSEQVRKGEVEAFQVFIAKIDPSEIGTHKVPRRIETGRDRQLPK